MITCDINSANDIYVVPGRPGIGGGPLRKTLAMASGARGRSIVIESVTRTHRGELRNDPDRGIDYIGTVLENRRYAGVCAAQIKKSVQEIPWVESVDDFSYSLVGGEMKWTMSIKTIDGETITVGGDGVEKKDIDKYYGISWSDIMEKPEWLESDVVPSIKTRLDKLTNGLTTEDLKKADTLVSVKSAVNVLLGRIREAEGQES